ncbi:barstar family protein [Peptococcus simiae]|uniref:barstar family protein n=1 Tax=Peptococcus simiae TaxID=1643805 RepID=UPI003981765D
MIIIDGREMLDRDTIHTYLKEKFTLSAHYGENLDALWDELSERGGLALVFLHADEMVDALGPYGNALLALFRDLVQENPNNRLFYEMPPSIDPGCKN